MQAAQHQQPLRKLLALPEGEVCRRSQTLSKRAVLRERGQSTSIAFKRHQIMANHRIVWVRRDLQSLSI